MATADVATGITPSTNPVLVGAPLSFDVTYTNAGPGTAAGYTQTLQLTAGLGAGNVTFTNRPAGVTATYNNATGVVTFTGVPTTLASGDDQNLTVNILTVPAGLTSITASTTIGTSTSQGPATGANSATSTVTVKSAPVPAYVTAPSMPSTNGPTAIPALTATDADGTVASFTIVTLPPSSAGTLSYNNGSADVPITSANFVLTAAQATTLKFNPTGTTTTGVSFTYTATDNEGYVSTTANNGGTRVTGAAVYTLPLTNGGISANNDFNAVAANSPKQGNVLLNDVNPNNTGLAVSLSGAATAGGTTTTFSGGTATAPHGTVVIAADGTYTYTPAAGYTGPDAFAYQVCSTSGTPIICATALVTLRVYDAGTACTSSSGANLVVNPDFNAGNTGFLTNYTFVPRPATAAQAPPDGLYPEGLYAVDADASYYHRTFRGTGRANATNANDKFLIVNGAASVQRVYNQTITVLPNRYYTFSAYVSNILPPGTNLGLPNLGFVINGESVSATRQITESPDRWVKVSDVWYSGSNTQATFEIRNVSTVAAGNDFGIDDVYFGTCNLPPVAANDLMNTPLNTPITFVASGSGTGSNDSDSDGFIDPTSVDLDPATAGVQTSLTTTAGTFVRTVTGSGATATVSVTFTPVTGFSGVASIPYVVQDNENAFSSPGTISVTVRPPAANLATTLSASASPVNGGATETLTVQSLNNGPATAQNVQQLLYLPAGLGTVTFGTPTVGSGATVATGTPSYNNATGLVTFPALTSQASGSTGTVTWTASFAAPGSGPIAATAAVSSSTNDDPDTSDNTASTAIAVNPRFDLSTTLSGPTTIVQGNLLTYNVTTANASGSSPVPSAVQTVTGLPTGLSQVFVSNGGYYNGGSSAVTLDWNGVSFVAGSTYSVPTGGVIFPPRPFAAGQTTSNTISFPATGAVSSTITPTASVTPNTSGAGDTNTANNTAFLNATGTASSTTVSGPTANKANLYATISTSAGSTPVAGGSSVTVNVTVGNKGPQTAANAVTTVTLQPGLTVSGLPTGASYDAVSGVVTFSTLGTLASAGTQAYSFTIAAPTSGPVLLAAAVRSDTSDPEAANNFASTKVDVAPATDMATTLAGPATATAGQPVTYTVTTRNQGTGTATGVAQTVTLPVGLTTTDLQLNGQPGTLSGTTITFADLSTYNVTTGVLTLPALASVPAGGLRVANVTFPAPAGGTLALNANVSSLSADADRTNNAATVTTTVQNALDVQVTLSGPATAPVYGPVTYAVTTTNNGPSAAPSVVPTLQLPTGLQASLVLPTGATYNNTTGLVTFATLASLPSGSSLTQSVSFAMPDVAQLTGLAAASVGGSTADRNLDNNRSGLTTRATTPTDPIADLSATVSASAGSVSAGAAVTFTATFANGPSATSDAATGVRPRLALPAGLNGVSVSNGGTYDATTGLVTWPVVSTLLASDATGYAALVYTVAVNAPDAATLSATASVSSATSDPALSNNSRAASVTVNAVVDVATYVSGPATATAGQPVTYTVTTVNNGPSTASAVSQTVTLPAGVTSYSLNGGAAISGSGTVTILTLASQQPGADGAVTQTITFTTPAPGSGTYSLSGNVTATGDAATTGNNASTTATALANRAPVALNVVNTLQTPQGNTANTANGLPISPLAATDADGNNTLVRYNLLSIPSTTQGVLYYDNAGTYAAVTAANYATLNLTPTQAGSLRFDPAATFVGNVMFQYTTTDNGNGSTGNVLTSLPALYTLPVAQDINSVYAATPAKGGASRYQTNDVLAYVTDTNGAAYNSSGLVYNPSGTTTTILAAGGSNGLVNTAGSVVQAPSGSGPAANGLYPANPTNVLPAGVSLNTTTGLIYVSDRTLLVNNNSVKYYQINVTTTDIYGGTNVVTAQFSIGAYPLPVELTDFTAKAAGTDGVLNWRTATEKNNDHFDVERSLNGTDFAKIGQVKGQGSKASPTDYALTDAGIGRKVSGLVYYRLRQVDADGTTTFSPVRALRFDQVMAPAVALYPNPAADHTTLDLTVLPAGSYQVRVLDATGREVLHARLDAGAAHALNLTNLASGTYAVLVQGLGPDGTSLNFTQRLIKE